MKRKYTSKEALERAAHEGKIDQKDAEFVLEFARTYGTLKSLSAGSLNKYHYALKSILMLIHSRKARVSFLSEKDVLSLIEAVRNHPKWSEETKSDYWTRFTVFYKWIEKRHGPWPGQAKDYLIGEDKFTFKVDPNKVEKKGILTPEEVLKLVHTEPDLAYKVYYSVLYESGMRAGEAETLLLRDVERNGNGYTLHLRTSKTEKRPIPLFQMSVRHLDKWLKLHPDAGNKDAMLFLNTIGHPLGQAAANKHLKWLLEQAGIQKKKVTLHSFRHSRATELAGAGMSEFEMCRMFGWTIGSKMPATYIRAGAIDVTGALKRAYGIEEGEKHEVKGITCIQCGHLNPDDEETCDICHLPLDGEKLKEIKEGTRSLEVEEMAIKLLEKARADIIESIIKELRKAT